VDEALRADRAAGEFICREIGLLSQVLDAKIDFGDQQRALHGRSKARHEKRVVAARVGKRHGAAGVAADGIGHQPLIAGGAVPIPASLSAEDQKRDLQFSHVEACFSEQYHNSQNIRGTLAQNV